MPIPAFPYFIKMYLRSESAMRDLWDGTSSFELHFPSGLRTSKPVLSLIEQSQVADHQSWDDASAQFTWPHVIHIFAITGNIASSRDRGREFWTRIAPWPRFLPSADQPVAYKQQSKKGNSQSVKILSALGPCTTLTVPPYPRQTSSSPLQMV